MSMEPKQLLTQAMTLVGNVSNFYKLIRAAGSDELPSEDKAAIIGLIERDVVALLYEKIDAAARVADRNDPDVATLLDSYARSKNEIAATRDQITGESFSLPFTPTSVNESLLNEYVQRLRGVVATETMPDIKQQKLAFIDKFDKFTKDFMISRDQNEKITKHPQFNKDPSFSQQDVAVADSFVNLSNNFLTVLQNVVNGFAPGQFREDILWTAQLSPLSNTLAQLLDLQKTALATLKARADKRDTGPIKTLGTSSAAIAARSTTIVTEGFESSTYDIQVANIEEDVQQLSNNFPINTPLGLWMQQKELANISLGLNTILKIQAVLGDLLKSTGKLDEDISLSLPSQATLQTVPEPADPKTANAMFGSAMRKAIELYISLLKTFFQNPQIRKLTALQIDDIVTLLNKVELIYDNVWLQGDLLHYIFLRTFYVDITDIYEGMNGVNEIPTSSFREVINLKEQVDYDTANFKALVEKLYSSQKTSSGEQLVAAPPDNSKYIFLYSFVEVAQHWFIDFSRKDDDKSITRNKQITLYVLQQMLGRWLPVMTKFINGVDKSIEPDTEDGVKLDNTLKEAKSPVITYIKVRLSKIGDSMSTYNQRFKLLTNKRSLYVEYNDHNFPFYNIDKPEIDGASIVTYVNKARALGVDIASTPFKEDGVDEYIAAGDDVQKRTDACALTKSSEWFSGKYNNKFLFGPFTQIFDPTVANKEIAAKADEVVNALTVDQRPVMILGYGASGAGKTSSLIYLNNDEFSPDEQRGILIHICSRLGKEYNYKKINVRAFEFFTNSVKDKVDDPVSRICIKDGTNNYIQFEFREETENDRFVLLNDYEHKNMWLDRTGSSTTKFAATSDMGQVLIHLIDTDRYVKATTNNPNSSRSHAVISVEFLKEGDDGKAEAYKPNLIIGDFAGVENIFACQDAEVLRKFANIKIKQKKTDSGPAKFFYEEYGVEEQKNKKFIDVCPTDGKDMHAFSDLPKFDDKIDGDEKITLYFRQNPTMYVAIEKLFLTSADIDMSKLRSSITNALADKNDLAKSKTAAESIWGRFITTKKAELKKLLDPKELKYPKDSEEARLVMKKKLKDKIVGREPDSIDAIADDFVNFIEFLKSVKIIEEDNPGADPSVKRVALIKSLCTLSGRQMYRDLTSSQVSLDGIKNFMDRIEQYTATTSTGVQVKGYSGFFRNESNYTAFFDSVYSAFCEDKSICTRVKKNAKGEDVEYKVLNFKGKINMEWPNDIYINRPSEAEAKKCAAEPGMTKRFPDWTEKEKVDFCSRDKVLYNDFKAKIPTVYGQFEKIAGEVAQNKQAFDEFWANFESTNKTFTVVFSDPIEKTINIQEVSKEVITKHCSNYVNSNELMKTFLKSSASFDLASTSQLDKLYNNLLKQAQVYLSDDKVDLSNREYIRSLLEKIRVRIASLLDGFLCKFGLAYYVCSVRKNEGFFINDSLSKMRSFIKLVLDKSANGTLYPLPLFEEACLPSYCIGETCFDKNEAKMEPYKSEHAIMKTMREELKIDPTKILFCIFCVLNISIDGMTNNPPPIPYLNVNGIKKLAQELAYRYNDFKDMPSNATPEVRKKKIKILQDVCERFLLQADALDFKIKYDMNIGIDNKTAEIVKDQTTYGYLEASCKNITKSFGVAYGNDDRDESREQRVYMVPQITKNESHSIDTKFDVKSFRRNLRVFCTLIDKNNAASAIGTLEFVDYVSKYYTTSAVCELSGPTPDMQEWNDILNVQGGGRYQTKLGKRKFHKKKISIE